MYSRKFNGVHTLPPDYSGIAMRPNNQKEENKTNCDNEQQDINDSYGTYPKYPVYEQDESFETDNKKAPSQINNRLKEQPSTQHNDKIYSLSKKNFSLEDIVLAGLILLIMNEDERDDGLLLILGFLLLIGLK